VTALMATSQTAQMVSHMNRGMDNGLTQVELSEVIPQVAFYAGWPKAFSAIPVARDVFAGRAKKM
jgi:4-carboxymuconolactone decarboxylase